MSQSKSPTVLIILDGFGYSSEKKYNAIYSANKLHFEYFLKHFPSTLLKASGKYVGLPDEYIGNSQVGHLTIGSGRCIDQPLTIIKKSIEDKSFFKNEILIKNLKKLKDSNRSLHIMGLFSNTGVHSIEELPYAFLKFAIDQNIKSIFVHPFLDGRDSPPKSAKNFLTKLDNFISKYNFIKIGSIHGRFYAMDRDHNWERTEQSYKILTEQQKKSFNNWQEAIDYYYNQNITDEFIPPTQLSEDGIVNDDDGIIFFNFRPDRARQLTAAFVQKDFNHFPIKKINLNFFITPVSYNTHLDTTILFPAKNINNTLMDILSENGLQTFSIAETEKYAHITYFFKGGKEEILPNETQILIPSMRVKSYVDNPCMSANEITQEVINSLKNSPKDFYLINYANADMVGHSGNFEATVKAIECLDVQLGKLYDEIVVNLNGTMYITADHGNAEIKFDEKTGQQSTMHTANSVPFIMVKNDLKDKKIELPLSALYDIKDFILKNLGIL